MTRIQTAPVSVDEILALVAHPSCGGTALFLGTVRDESAGRRVTAMSYQAYEPMASARLAELELAIEARWPAARVAIVHRTGALALGEVSVAVAVSCPHRSEAFEACRFGIDTLKMTTPIWKKEFGDGGAVWVEGDERRPA